MPIVRNILEKRLFEAKSDFYDMMESLIDSHLTDRKHAMQVAEFESEFGEEGPIDEALFKIVKARIRGGKIQRRKKVAAKKGFTMRGGKVTRMTTRERLNRKRSQRRGAIKRRSKASKTKMKMKRILRKRKTMGLFK